MPRLRSWTSDEETRFYSGEAVYEKHVILPSTAGKKLVLDFGPGTPAEPASGASPGMHALLEGPVHEAAIVFVNGQRAGAVWHPPYAVEVTRYVHAGDNLLRMQAANLAINEMAGQVQPDYRLLNLRYGERFVPQDMKNLRPLSSGILGPLRLLIY